MENRSRQQSTQQDSGGQTASPNPGDRFDQEKRVKETLTKEFDKSWQSEQEIRNEFNIRGYIADFVGYDSGSNQWVIAESKGSDLTHAVEQLENTQKGLPSGAKVEFRIYIDAKNYSTLANGGNFGGYYMNLEGVLGYYNDLQEWTSENIGGTLINILQAPSPQKVSEIDHDKK